MTPGEPRRPPLEEPLKRPLGEPLKRPLGEWPRRRVNCMQLVLMPEPCPLAVRSGRMLAMPRVVQVPDIRKVDLPEARQAIPHVHAYLRECILNGTLSPGTKL